MVSAGTERHQSKNYAHVFEQFHASVTTAYRKDLGFP